MRTYVLARKELTAVVEIAGPCIEADLVFDDGCEVIDECLFRTLYPEEYKRHLLENFTDATATWIESFYDEEKQLMIENSAIFTADYIIQPTLSEVHVMIQPWCDPSEIAALVLHLRRNVPEEIQITVTPLPIACERPHN